MTAWRASLLDAYEISFTLNAADRRRLEAIVADRNTPQKHVWRCRIELMGWMPPPAGTYGA